MHATRKLVFPSGPIDVTGTFQVESEAISNEKRFRWKDFQTAHPRIVKVKKAYFQPCSLVKASLVGLGAPLGLTVGNLLIKERMT